MDKTNRNIAALGALTILAIAVFFWGLYYLLGSTLARGGMDVYVAGQNAGGLKRGDRVLYQGVIVGNVRDIELGDRGGVVAALRLNQKLPLPSDTKASITGDVFGAHSIDLLPGTAIVKLEKGDTLAAVVAPGLADAAGGLTTSAQTVLNRADALLSERAIANVQATTENLRVATSSLPATNQQIRATLAELRSASATMRQTAQGLQDAKTAEALTAAINRIDKGAETITVAANNLNQSIVSLQSVFGKIDRGDGTLGKLVNDSSLYAELQGAAREFRSLAADIKAHPKRYIDLKIF